MASIRERPLSGGGQVWAVLYRHGGKQASQTFVDPQAAEQFRAEIDLLGPERALAALHAVERPQGISVDEIAQRFLSWKARDVTPRTAADYRRDYDNWVAPRFGHREAAAVDEMDVQEWVDLMARTLSPKSVADRHMLLHSIYQYGRARSRRLVEHNPCLETELPRRTKKPPKGTTVAEWRAILGAAANRDTDARDLILFLGSVGWRWSEGAALAVRDVDDDGEVVHVNVTRVFRIVDNRQVLIDDAAKSYAGFRRVPILDDETTAAVRRRLVGKTPDDYVFTNRRGVHWRQNSFLRDTWPALTKEAGLTGRKITPHWLRHMAVAVLAASGATADEIRRYIGHENIGTTYGTYGGMLGGLEAGVRERANLILSGRGPKGFVVSGELVGPDAQLGLQQGVQVLEPEVDELLRELEQ